MSSFLVSEKTIAEIIYTLNNLPREYFLDSWVRRQPALLPAFDHEREFGTALWGLNQMALVDRYTSETVQVRVYRPQSGKCSIIQGIKSLQCFLYQCNEGQISETPFYKTLEEFLSKLETAYIMSLSEYEKAHWD